MPNTGISLIDLLQSVQTADSQISSLNASQSSLSMLLARTITSTIEDLSSNFSASILAEKTRAVDAEVSLQTSLETTRDLLSTVEDTTNANKDTLLTHAVSLDTLKSHQIIFNQTQSSETNRLDAINANLLVDLR